MKGQDTIVLSDLKGLFDRQDRPCPWDHFTDLKNLYWNGKGLTSRPPIVDAEPLFGLGSILKWDLLRIVNGIDRKIIFDNTGKFYDLSNLSPTTPILTVPGVFNFSMISLYGRAYITIHDGDFGIQNGGVYVYDPSIVTTVAVSAGGTGYVVGEILTLLGGTGCTVKVATLSGSAVATVTLLQGGTGYSLGVKATTSNLVGTGCTINVTVLNALARLAAGTPPTGSITVVTSATAGKVEVGTYIISIARETNTGFITPPGPFAVYTAPGGKKIDISSIPTTGSDTSRRHILVTKKISNYNGDPKNYEPFFHQVIENNIDTTLTIDFVETELVASADYLFDELQVIPAGVCIGRYQASMVVAGEFARKWVARVSKGGEPESFSDIDGFCNVGPGDGGGVKNLAEMNGLLYFFKLNRTLSTQDNGLPPSSWPVIEIECGIGCDSNGISEINDDSKAHHQGALLVKHISGIYIFNGAYNYIPITFKIDRLYRNELQQLDYRLTQVLVDTIRKHIYVQIHLSTGIHKLYVADYSAAFDPLGMKWMVWTSDILKDGILVFRMDRFGILYFTNSDFQGDSVLKKIDPGDDTFFSIESGITPIQIAQTSDFLTFDKTDRMISHIEGVGFYAYGDGENAKVIIITPNAAIPGVITLPLHGDNSRVETSIPGLDTTVKFRYVPINRKAERFGIKIFSDTSATIKFGLWEPIYIWGKSYARDTPR